MKKQRKHAERLAKIKPLWEGINLPSNKDDWEKFEKSNVTIALRVLYVKKEKIYPCCSKKNQHY